ncbi:MAG TPA: hypothetical protein PJ982_02430, partial [Lacipirellulaceae bacterium]|nr:hypothetical protein [Lacipirellulaceae bacterium]
MLHVDVLRGTRQIPQHAGKHALVERIDSVPVDQSPQPQRIKYRRLADIAPWSVRSHFKLQPCAAGEFHFRLQPQLTRRVVKLHAPEIEVIADAQLPRIIQGRRLHYGFVMALISALVVWVIMKKTALGY